MGNPIHRFGLGSFSCIAVSDGRYTYDAGRFVANAAPAELAAALAGHGVADRVTTPYSCVLVDTGSHRVLLDTGGAGWDPGVGRLPASLRVAGVDPASIDVVVLTHGHPDHIGGNADELGRPVYKNALHVMATDEWAFWTSPHGLARVPERFRQIAEASLPPIADRLHLIDGDAAIVPGIHALPTPGHTPGHIAVVVEDDGEELLYISDAAIHPIHLEHPDWYPLYDLDPKQAIASKRMLFDRAARRGSLVHAYHFDPFPCLGHVEAVGEGWRWTAVPADRPVAAGR